MTTRRTFLICSLALLAVTACAAPKEADSPKAPSAGLAAESSESKAQAPPAYAPPPPGYPAAPGPMPATPSATAPAAASSAPGGARAMRLQAFAQASVMLDRAASDCKAACRALDAMDRTAGELCELDHDGVCTDATGRVRGARDRVRTACGSCPDGVTLDRNAPVPSRR